MPQYTVRTKLGKGGFGQIFRACRLLQRKVTPVNKPNQVSRQDHLPLRLPQQFAMDQVVRA